jgi:hypothetical protein
MDHILVRTKLQTLIAGQLIAEGIVSRDPHVVVLARHDDDTSASDVEHQLQRLSDRIEKVSRWDRSRDGFILTLLRFLVVLLRSKLSGGVVYVANINWYPFAFALKIAPRMSIRSFDDGTANIERRPNSYLSETPPAGTGIVGWAARKLFPRGAAYFVRQRIDRHYSIYPGLENIAEPGKLNFVAIDWARLASSEDLESLPAVATRIFIGSVYNELNRREHQLITPELVATAIAWCEVHIPHPRHARDIERMAWQIHLPAESIIEHFAKTNNVTVAHFGSSAILPFRDDPRVRAIDLLNATDRNYFCQQAASAGAET